MVYEVYEQRVSKVESPLKTCPTVPNRIHVLSIVRQKGEDGGPSTSTPSTFPHMAFHREES